MAKKATAEVISLGGQVPTNGGEDAILAGEPYVATVRLVGTADYLFHAWNCEAVEEKANAKKGSKVKKTDDLESYVYRDSAGFLSIPGTQLRATIINAARYRQDPRSPRKSAMDLYKAAIVPLTDMASVGVKTWEYEHKCRVLVQRNAITRARPALRRGWSAEWDLQVLLPEYIEPADLNDTITKAGVFCGLGDFRPTYGRFQIVSFTVHPIGFGAS